MARKLVCIVTYEGSDISDIITPMVTGVRYVDHKHGKSDEIELSVEDTDRRWRELWYPDEGDTIDVKVGFEGEALLPCGQFSIDEIELGDNPRTATIRGLAVPVSTPLRTVSTRGYDDTNLAAIVEDIASRHNMTVLGDIGDLDLRRVTQQQETDLFFLRRLAEKYGYAFTVRANQLVFYPLLELEARDPVLTIPALNLGSGTNLRGTAQKTYVACEVTYMDPETGKPITVRVEASGIKRGTTFGGGGTAARPTAPKVVLRQNSPHKAEVRDWQKFLQGRGQYTGAIDGIYGRLSERGTRAFQSEQTIGVDGVVGPITYDAAIDVGFLAGTDGAGGVSAVGDVLRINERVESAAEAEMVARARLHAANRLRVAGNIQLEGNPLCLAGVKIHLPDAGRLSGDYLVDKSTHNINRQGGYKTDAEVAHVS
jgi:phage protein D